MLNHSVRKMLAVALVSVPVIWSGATYTAQAQDAQDIEFKLAQVGEDIEFTLINNFESRSLTHFYVSPSESEDWGPDILGEGVVVEPGDFTTVTIYDGALTCNYDLKATFGPGEDVGAGDIYQTNINVCEMSSYTYFEN
ncbi:hypothetical protein [Laspinema olomoucense]|uniref:Uncharacterized protein n=1 Tax=Laspinema olomoucense D3b TaxID=2953688 RepID=A0ABT2N378_9CYAN|nr:hypothetical protein [Laspinema sp. D3b]MCT7977143.1 hypothetical protein [Laspinema sp. D3b]